MDQSENDSEIHGQIRERFNLAVKNKRKIFQTATNKKTFH